MTELQAALYRYARESRVERFLRPERRELEANRRMVGEAMASLSAMGEAPADLARRVEQGLQLCADLEQEASFLVGLAVGLELGRM